MYCIVHVNLQIKIGFVVDRFIIQAVRRLPALSYFHMDIRPLRKVFSYHCVIISRSSARARIRVTDRHDSWRTSYAFYNIRNAYDLKCIPFSSRTAATAAAFRTKRFRIRELIPLSSYIHTSLLRWALFALCNNDV